MWCYVDDVHMGQQIFLSLAELRCTMHSLKIQLWKSLHLTRLSGELIKLQLLFQDHCQKQRSTAAHDSLDDLKVINLKDGHECSFFLNYHVNFNDEAFFS